MLHLFRDHSQPIGQQLAANITYFFNHSFSLTGTAGAGGPLLLLHICYGAAGCGIAIFNVCNHILTWIPSEPWFPPAPTSRVSSTMNKDHFMVSYPCATRNQRYFWASRFAN